MTVQDASRPARRLVYVQGDHVCALYTTPEEQLAAAVDYIRQGLARGERCLYVVGEHDLTTFRDALAAGGIDVPAEEARGALILVTKHDAHLKGGAFDPRAMIDLLETAVNDALGAGFTGLCAAGDMNWVLDEAPGTERLAEYEAELNDFYRSSRALGLCLYRRNLPNVVLDHCLATHAAVRVGGQILLTNPFYELPEIARTRVADPAAAEAKVQHFLPN
jgi:hypothetical protein